MVDVITRGIMLILLVVICIFIGVGATDIGQDRAKGDDDGARTSLHIVRFLEGVMVVLVVLLMLK